MTKVYPRTYKPCAVDGCPKHGHSHGLCQTHWYRLTHHGTTDKVQRQRRDKPRPSFVESAPWQEIPLTRGHVALVDTDLFSELAQYAWFEHQGYAMRAEGRDTHIFMHHHVLSLRGIEVPPGMQVDHRNINSLDNRSDNLRVVTHSFNNHNRHVSSANTSGFRGVYWYAAGRKWRATLKVNKKTYHLGGFEKLEDAVAAYQAARMQSGLPLIVS